MTEHSCIKLSKYKIGGRNTYDMLWHLVNPVLAVDALITVGKALMCNFFPSYHSVFRGKTACDKVAESLVNLIVGVDFICLSVAFLTIIKFV